MVEYLYSTDKAIEIGTRIGKAMARDHIAECIPVGFSLNDEDGDQLNAAGIFEGSPEWDQAVSAAKDEYSAAMKHVARRADGLDNPCSTNSGSATWDDVMAACEYSDSVKMYDDCEEWFEITWCDGSTSRFGDAAKALESISLMGQI